MNFFFGLGEEMTRRVLFLRSAEESATALSAWFMNYSVGHSPSGIKRRIALRRLIGRRNPLQSGNQDSGYEPRRPFRAAAPRAAGARGRGLAPRRGPGADERRAALRPAGGRARQELPVVGPGGRAEFPAGAQRRLSPRPSREGRHARRGHRGARRQRSPPRAL